MRIYEELFIVRPDITEEEVDPIIDQVRSTVTTGGGTIDKVDKWGVRKLAYRLGKRNEGYYVLVQFSSAPNTVKEIERRLRVNDAVLKFITVRIDEKLKKIEKRKKDREKRAARKPQVAAPPPGKAMPSEPAASTPGAPLPGAPAPAAPAPASPAPAAAAPVTPAENEG
jgi:small subunit ribosomal protein S6